MATWAEFRRGGPRAFHLLATDVTEVGYFRVVDGGHDARTWRP